MPLSREQILGINDIQVKEIDVPEWNDTVYIRQLTRGEQDEYMKRQFGSARLKQDKKASQQEFAAFNIYGHDAFICACGICDDGGNRLFKPADMKVLNEKNGDAIGYIASQIVEFSGMKADVEAAEELKNSQETQT